MYNAPIAQPRILSAQSEIASPAKPSPPTRPPRHPHRPQWPLRSPGSSFHLFVLCPFVPAPARCPAPCKKSCAPIALAAPIVIPYYMDARFHRPARGELFITFICEEGMSVFGHARSLVLFAAVMALALGGCSSPAPRKPYAKAINPPPADSQVPAPPALELHRSISRARRGRGRTLAATSMDDPVGPFPPVPPLPTPDGPTGVTTPVGPLPPVPPLPTPPGPGSPAVPASVPAAAPAPREAPAGAMPHPAVPALPSIPAPGARVPAISSTEPSPRAPSR